MPQHPRRPCRQLYCPAFADASGWCPKHKPVAPKQWGNAAGGKVYDKRHQLLRKAAFQRDRGLCQMCLREGRYESATVAHHIKAVKEHPELKYNLDNIASLCWRCHEKIHGRPGGKG